MGLRTVAAVLVIGFSVGACAQESEEAPHEEVSISDADAALDGSGDVGPEVVTIPDVPGDLPEGVIGDVPEDVIGDAPEEVEDEDSSPEVVPEPDVAIDVPPEVIEPWVYPLDDTLRLNHVQALGTHNSYHVQPQAPLHPSHKFTMPSLTDQLELHGVRQFEWDLHWHKAGHLEVFHIPVIDQVSTCTLFTDCLEETLAWSLDHPDHFPIIVWMELKDDVDNPILGNYDTLEWHYQDVEDDILSVFEAWALLTPDEVRGEHETLPAALSDTGWPTLGALRGRLVFVFLEDGHHRDNYLEGSPALEGKLIFVDSDTGEEPFAAFFKINNAKTSFDEVVARVSEGFIVTSNVDDVDGSEGGNQEKFAASLDSGAHFLSSNFPESQDDGSYYAAIPGGAPVRCNPVAAPEQCTSVALENLGQETP
jgi:hypothetical protein